MPAAKPRFSLFRHEPLMKKSKKPFPIYLALLLAVFIAFLAWSARQAATDGARITDRDYYSKGLRYNTTQVERRAASVLGWRLSTELVEHSLILAVVDKTGQPVSGADVSLQLLLPSGPISLEMTETEAGRYRMELPHELSGELSARYAIEREGARLEHLLLINL